MPRERARRKMYYQERLEVFLGVKVTPDMNAALEAAAERAGRVKTDFLRLMIAEGLKSWAFKDLRVLKKDDA